MEPRVKLASRIMQAGMVAVVIAGIATGNFTWVPAALVSLLVSLIPSLLRRDFGLVLPIELNFWIVLALFLHVIGGFSGFYDKVPGWDHVTHVISASLVAALGFVAVVTIDKYVTSMYLPRPFLGFFIVMFTMAFGVLWELMEFANDQLTGSRLQYGLNDTMFDMMFDAYGGFVVAFAGTHYLKHTSPEHFVEKMRVDEVKERIKGILKKRRKAGQGD